MTVPIPAEGADAIRHPRWEWGACRAIQGHAGATRTLAYSQRVMALGAHPIRVPVQGHAAERVCSINSLKDFSVFHSALRPYAQSADSS